MEQAIEVSLLSTLMTSFRTRANSVPKDPHLDLFLFTTPVLISQFPEIPSARGYV